MNSAEIIHKLRVENAKLKEDYDFLLQKSNAKRYKFIDSLVDGAYKLMPRRKKPTPAAEEAAELAANPEVQIQPRGGVKRKFEKGKVYILAVNFYDWQGKIVYKGGAERYIYDLALLLKSLKYHPVILQGADADFEKTYRGVKIRGVKMPSKDVREISRVYNNICQDAEFIVVSPLELACEVYDVPAIGINHGIAFDGPNASAFSQNPHGYDIYHEALENCQQVVCVDTNFINWARTRDHALSEYLVFIPNYYDAKVFRPSQRRRSNKKVTCVYPRRLYSARGYDIAIQAFRKLFKKYPYLKLNFVGQVDSSDVAKDLKKFMQDFPQNVEHLEYSMKDMYKAYEPADIVLVPTRYSEGTSLSCIEGMVSGSAVIATNIGGLPNLIIDHYNGLLISPTAADLEKAVSELVDKPALRAELSKNGRAIAKAAFEKQLWEKRWKAVFSAIIE